MNLLDQNLLEVPDHYYRNNGEFFAAEVPDLLITSNREYIPIYSKDVLFFTKNGQGSRLYCTNKISFDIDIPIADVSVKLLRFATFKRIKDNVIINLQQVDSYRQNGRKYIFLKNGEEILLDQYMLNELIESMLAA